jgi:putative lipoprotein
LLFSTVSAYPVITRGSPSQVALELHPVRTPPAPPLVGTRWLLRDLGGMAVSGAVDLPAAYLELRADGRYTGVGGCNHSGGSYRLDGAALHFSAGQSTLMACPPPLDEQEIRFAQALHGADNFVIDGNRLRLRRGDAVSAFFEAATPR